MGLDLIIVFFDTLLSPRSPYEHLRVQKNGVFVYNNMLSVERADQSQQTFPPVSKGGLFWRAFRLSSHMTV